MEDYKRSNGTPPKPAFVLMWDNDTQTLSYAVDNGQIKNSDMLVGVLTQALDLAKFNATVAKHQHLQAIQMQAAQEERIRRDIIH